MALLITIVIPRNLPLFKEEDSSANPSASDTDGDERGDKWERKVCKERKN